jgi:P-type Ca2+ transporter type 2C
MNLYHTKTTLAVEQELTTSSQKGLSINEVRKRQEQYGKNKLDETKPKSLFKRFIEQIADFMIGVLLAAAFISFFTGEEEEAILILVIVLINAILGIVQESKAEKSLEAIKKLSSPNAKVIRDGKQQVISIEELVPGDLIVIDAGDFMPADCRLIESHSLKVDESALTGEAVPVEKDIEIISDESVALGDRINCGFMSTVVTYGRGKGIVFGTGMKTEMGKIANMLNESATTQTPLQKSLAELGKILAILALAISALIFVIGLFQGQELSEMFITAISLAVAAIPEGLPAIVTIVLAIGMQNLVKRKAIMRKLPAVETLGSTDIICSDKTGTLTQNKMTIEKLYVNQETNDVKEIESLNEDQLQLILYGVLCNDTKVQQEDDGLKTIGDPTEIALIDLANRLTINPIEQIEHFKRLYELPFDSDRKLMTTINEIDGKIISITKGAPDVLFAKATKIELNNQVKPLTTEDLNTISNANLEMANQALRVLAFGYKVLEQTNNLNELTQAELEHDLIFIGLVGMIDPPREEAKEAIKLCKQAGIKTIMITGDHKNTAVAIAKQLGIIEEAHEAISGFELDQISDTDFNQEIEKYGVYARVSPENKVRIVKTWQSKGKVVAMTGDGVNDAPALKNADIGVAMGITGTEVAKGASDMVLTDDNFSTIVSAVEEGRTIFSNIKKAIHFLLSCNTGEIITILLGTLLGTLIFDAAITPLTATQILWVNLVTDSLAAIALGLEKSEPDVMNQLPRDTTKSIFHGGLGYKIAVQGALLGVLSFIAYYIGYSLTKDYHIAQTMTFMTLAFTQLFHAFNARSENHSIFKIGLFSNKYLILAFVASTILQLFTISFNFSRQLFDIVTLTINQSLIVLGLSILPIVIVELHKLLTKKVA